MRPNAVQGALASLFCMQTEKPKGKNEKKTNDVQRLIFLCLDFLLLHLNFTILDPNSDVLESALEISHGSTPTMSTMQQRDTARPPADRFPPASNNISFCVESLLLLSSFPTD